MERQAVKQRQGPSWLEDPNRIILDGGLRWWWYATALVATIIASSSYPWGFA